MHMLVPTTVMLRIWQPRLCFLKFFTDLWDVLVQVVQSLLPHINAFKPDLILMSAGFDAHKVRIPPWRVILYLNIVFEELS